MQKQYSNQHLIEVNCGFQFTEETTRWDSTYFGQYYDKIKNAGFIEKEERKGFQIQFAPNNSSSFAFSNQNAEDQVVFKDSTKGRAILLGKDRISFHIIQNYTNWDDFLNLFIKPFIEYYFDLGLGNGARECSIIYLNRFSEPFSFKISDYFSIFSDVKNSYSEIFTSGQRIFDNGDNLLIAKLNSQIQSNLNYVVNLECGATCKNIECKKQDWEVQANNTHKPIKVFFESLITNKLRDKL